MMWPRGSMPTLLGPQPQLAKFTPIRLTDGDQVQGVTDLLESLRAHATFTWVVLPLLAFAQVVLPILRPTCSKGFSDVSLLAAVALIFGSHFVMESQAWGSAKSLASEPEMVVMRTYGILKRRRWLVFIGLLEAINFYNDLTFPILAYECRSDLTERWAESWATAPLVGPIAVSVLHTLRFWGLSAICVVFVIVVGLTGLISLFGVSAGSLGLYDGAPVRPTSSGSAYGQQEPPRLSAYALVNLARHSEGACTPSVACWCTELALQRRWVFCPKEELGGALGAARARESVIFGKAKPESLEQYELRDKEVLDRVDAAGSMYSCAVLIGKVLIGGALPLWLQANFFQLAFDVLGPEARLKLTVRVALSAFHVAARLMAAPFKTGLLGIFVSVVGLFATVWAALKVGYGLACPDHVWMLFQGCMDL